MGRVLSHSGSPYTCTSAVYSFIHSLIHSLIHSFIHSLIPSFSDFDAVALRLKHTLLLINAQVKTELYVILMQCNVTSKSVGHFQITVDSRKIAIAWCVFAGAEVIVIVHIFDSLKVMLQSLFFSINIILPYHASELQVAADRSY